MSIDMHCHHFTFKNGGYIHPKFINSWRIRMYLAGIGLIRWRDAIHGNLPGLDQIDEMYRAKLVTETVESTLDHVVALAFDGIYDEKGLLNKHQTIKYVSNDAVLDLMRDSPKFLLGASVNPLRRDWKDELEKCLDQGAALIKWLPSVMNFDPADKRIDPFYQRLYDTGTPILMHVGFELALPTANTQFAHMNRLERVLQTGVTVIAAHCCGGWPMPFFDIASLWEFPVMRRLIGQYPNLYFDIAGMMAPHRKPRLMSALADPVIRERIVYGTDYPITLHGYAFRKQARGLVLPKNFYEKDMIVKERCGLTPSMLERGYEAMGRRLSVTRVHPNCGCR